MNKLSSKLKGHGYLKKTKLGLVSGIILASSLFVSLGSNTFVLAEETNTNPTENVGSNGKSEAKDEFVREETVPVKEAELTDKVKEVKEAGVSVEEKPVEVVGVAKSETEETTLKKKAETKVDEQIKALEEARKEELARQEKVKEINSIREFYVNNNSMKHFLVHHLNSREFDEDFNKTVEFSDFKSDKGDVHFVEGKRAILRRPDSIVNSPITTVPTKVKTILYKNNINLTPLQEERLNKLVDSYILKVKDGETISYNIKVNDESYLRKTFGIDTIEVKRTYNFGLANNPEYFDVITDKMIERIYIFSDLSKSTNLKEANPNVITEYFYKDSTGMPISLKDLYAKVINISVFNGQEVIKSSDIRDENMNAPEQVRIQNDTSDFQLNSYEGKVTPEGRISQKFNYSFIDNVRGEIQNHYFSKKDVLKNVDYKKLMEPVSANYHLVTYKKLIDTGVVQQKFVDEKGNEIAPTITSEKSDKGTTVTVATPPNEITYKGQTYLLQTEKIPNSLVIEKGINPVTFSYKLQVVTDKGKPEPLEVPEFNGGVVPNEAPKLEVPEYNGPVSMKGDPLILEVPEYNGPISMKGDPLTLEVPEYNRPINQVGEPEVQPELPKLVLNNEQTNSQTKVQKPVETVNSSKQSLPKTGSSYNGVYYTISASILSLFGVLSLNFKKKDMK
ncbi:SIALI-17 repeat-containing surface protein [uncultured Granulicatella sp.]|uniref:SIALI-17 repeat-containing surface protein n=1 Tax=uncultured Granulicatella sp. TaxID=316089 RepID=UPI0028D5089A|nr:SIALI-17 repeat-containing surface protein [uncultured Granulicatella sp.]